MTRTEIKMQSAKPTSLRRKVLFAIGSCLLGSLGSFIFAITPYFDSIYKDVANDSTYRANEFLEQYITEKIDDLKIRAKMISSLPVLRAVVESGDVVTMQDKIEFYKSELVIPIITIASPDGEQFVGTEDNRHLGAVLKKVVDLGPLPSPKVFYGRFDNELTLQVVTSIGEVPEHSGWISLGVLLNQLMVKQLEQNTGVGLAFLVNGELLSFSIRENGQQVFSRSSLEGYISGEKNPDGFVVKKQTLKGHSDDLIEVMSFYPTKKFQQARLQLFALIAILFIILTIIFGWAGNWFSRRLVKPLRNLTSTMTEITDKGTYSAELEYRDNAEVFNLCSSFNQMMEVIQTKQSELEFSRDFLDKVFQSLSEMILIAKTDGNLISVNSAARKVLLENRNLPENYSVKNFTEEENWTFFWKNTTEGVKEKDISLFSTSGEKIPVVLTSEAVEDQDGQHFVIISAKDARDSRLVQELQKAQEQLVDSEKMAALGQMAGGVAHEINNPLAIIHGSSELLVELLEEEEEIDKEEFLENVDIIRTTAIRAANVVRGLRTISRESEGDPLEPTPVKEILEETYGLSIARFRDSEIKLEFSEFLGDTVISCRKGQIVQVLLNLLNNAFDAVSEMKSNRSKKVQMNVTVTDKVVEFSVVDNGPGIAEGDREKIFDVFYTTKAAGEGTGLGLSIVKKLVSENAGAIELRTQSEPTEFQVSIPISKAS